MGRVGSVAQEAFEISETIDLNDFGRGIRVGGELGRVAEDFGRAIRPGDEIGRAAGEIGRAAHVASGTGAVSAFTDTLSSAIHSVGAGIAGLSEAGIGSLARAFEPLGLNLDNLAAAVGGRGPLGALASLPDPAASLGRAELPGGRRLQEVSEHLQNPQLDLHGLLGETHASLTKLGESISSPLGGLRELLGGITQDAESLGEHMRAAHRRG